MKYRKKALRARRKADALARKLGQAQAALPTRRRLHIAKGFDPRTGRAGPRLVLEKEPRPRSETAPIVSLAAQAGRCAGSFVHQKLHEVEQENVGTEAAHKTEQTAESLLLPRAAQAWRREQDRPWRRAETLAKRAAKADARAARAEILRDTPSLQKRRLKRRYAFRWRQEHRSGKHAAAQAGRLLGSMGRTAAQAIRSHPAVLFAAIGCGLLLVLVLALFSSCTAMLEGAAGSVLSTSYTAADHDILAAEAAYTALESDLQSRLANTEALYPGYDEYRYQADEIGHDPHQLIAFLTVRFQSFSAADVQPGLEQLFTAQYNLSTREETEVRTRTEIQYDRYGRPQTVEVEYPWRILYVTLQNHTLPKATDTLLTEQEQARCSLLVQLQGNRPDLFRDSIYSPSLPEDYEIPADALADPQFAALIAEGEKFLGFRYVWGGSTPETSFDCSGFVCWVYTHSGVHSLPRTTAAGLYNQCSVIPPELAQPGDLIFFTGTYDTPKPVSHVGIYVGGGRMLHAGSPIQYTRIDTAYWQHHFLAFGRL